MMKIRNSSLVGSVLIILIAAFMVLPAGAVLEQQGYSERDHILVHVDQDQGVN